MKFSYEGRAGSWGDRYSEQVSFPGKGEERQRTEEEIGVSSKEGCRDSMRGAGHVGKVLAEGETWVWDTEQSGAPQCTVGHRSFCGAGGSCPQRSQVFTPRHTKEAQMFEKHLD